MVPHGVIILSLFIVASSVVFLSYGIQVFGIFFSSLFLSCSSEERNGIICKNGMVYVGWRSHQDIQSTTNVKDCHLLVYKAM